MPVYYSGAVEAASNTAGFQTIDVDLKATKALIDTVLARTHPVIVLPLGAWKGVLLPYQAIYTLWLDTNGNVRGSDGDSDEPHPQVYQYLRERWGVENANSLSVGI